ncbi:MAG: sulfatase [Planctomycetes bacterium]|nr:sulfatase [Planctomycetota bacterium]
MTHRPLLLAARLIALALLGGCSGGKKGPPNVLLISIDTLRPDRLGCYGHERETSPTLDGLAKAGVLFTDVTAASPWTLPSHASILTGRYPSRHGVKDHVNHLRRGVPTLASVLRGKGYKTMAVVNSHNLSERYGLNRGFLAFEYLEEQLADGSIPSRGPEILEKARGWLEAERTGPFFLFLHFYDVHSDFTPGESYREKFVRPYDGTKDGAIDGTTEQLARIRNGVGEIDADGVRFLLDMYDAEIRELDDLLGEFLAWLAQQGLAENTLVAITSDHGEEFMEHGSLLHGRTYFQEVIRVPLLLCGPGVPADLRVATPAHQVDIAPTLLALAGADIPKGLDGLDLSAAWREGALLPQRLLFAEADHNNQEPDVGRMVRTAGQKLLYNRLTEAVQLYDLELDPGESADRAEVEPESAERLMESLRAFLSGEQEREMIDAPSEAVQESLKELGY